MVSADASASLWETYKRYVGSILSTTDQELAYTTAVSSFLASGCVPLSSTAAVREVSGLFDAKVHSWSGLRVTPRTRVDRMVAYIQLLELACVHLMYNSVQPQTIQDTHRDYGVWRWGESMRTTLQKSPPYDALLGGGCIGAGLHRALYGPVGVPWMVFFLTPRRSTAADTGVGGAVGVYQHHQLLNAGEIEVALCVFIASYQCNTSSGSVATPERMYGSRGWEHRHWFTDTIHRIVPSQNRVLVGVTTQGVPVTVCVVEDALSGVYVVLLCGATNTSCAGVTLDVLKSQCGRITLAPSNHATRFYEKHGFVLVNHGQKYTLMQWSDHRTLPAGRLRP